MPGVNDTQTAPPAREARRVVFVAFEEANPLDVAGPSTAFAFANAVVPGSYELHHASSMGGQLVTESGLSFGGLVPLRELPAPIDTVLLAGGSEGALRRSGRDTILMTWLEEQSSQVRRMGSVCTGAFLLAGAGLLDGRRAVTHWAACASLRQMFPEVEVLADAMYVQDDGIFTSAGVCAGIDLSLALIEDDLGTAAAAKVARSMVVFLRRSGSQSQFSEALAAQTNTGGSFDDLITWMADHLQADLSVSALARRAHMSERNFQRRFREKFGRTPAAFVKAMRLEAARRWLETTDWPIKAIAARAGLGSADVLERALKKSCGLSPAALRAAYGRSKLSKATETQPEEPNAHRSE
jgi:transcriptional regulator GlxA family with amidase domain